MNLVLFAMSQDMCPGDVREAGDESRKTRGLIPQRRRNHRMNGAKIVTAFTPARAPAGGAIS